MKRHDEDPEPCWHDFDELEPRPSRTGDILAVLLWTIIIAGTVGLTVWLE
jgi:hypothetical protein